MTRHLFRIIGTLFVIFIVGFAGIAQAMGCKGLKIEDPADFKPALSAAIDSDRPALIDVVINQEPHFRLMM